MTKIKAIYTYCTPEELLGEITQCHDGSSHIKPKILVHILWELQKQIDKLKTKKRNIY